MVAASQYEARLEDLHREDSLLKRAARFVFGMVTDSKLAPNDLGGRWVVRVVDMRSGDIVVELQHGQDAGGARLDYEYVHQKLQTLSPEQFRAEYGITDPS